MKNLPWKILNNGSAYCIYDGIGRMIAAVYYRENPASHITFLSKEEALEMAQAIARMSLNEEKPTTP